MATRRSVTTITEPLYQEGDVLVKSTNGLPTYGMTEADMQNMQLAARQQAAAEAQAQRTADIVNAARSGSITYGGNQGGAVTYGGGQGGVTILPDIRRDGDGVWLANMAQGRPIDLGPTAGWSGFNGQGQFVGFPSGMPHVLYGGFMDTLAPFMQYFAPMFRQAQTVAAQTPVAPATPATPSRRRTDTTGTTTEDVTVGTGPVSRDITDNAWSIRTPATTWLEEAKRNIAGVDPETGQPILDLESIKPTEDLIMTGPRGNVIRFTPETTQERQLQQYSVPQFDTSVDIPTMEIPDYIEPEVGDIDWSTAIGTGGTAGFAGEIPDVSPEVANSTMTALSLLSLLMGGGSFGSIAKLGSRLFGGASKVKQAMSNIDKLSRVMQPSTTRAERAANAARIQNLVGGRAPTVVRRDNIVTPQPIIRPIR